MKRPDQRPMRSLPLLEAHRGTLEKCVFCPKLCRSACPVSNAEPRETITPWGKMSMSYFAAHGDVPMDASHARPAWACTGCMACRESCDHRNDVATTLFAARAGFVDNGVAPPAANRTIAGFAAHARATRQAVMELAAHPAVRADSRTALLIGCAYARALPPEARAAIDAAAGLVRGPVALVSGCCGLPLLHAGDRAGFARQAAKLAEETAGKTTVLVSDAGCAMALRSHFPQVGAALAPAVQLLVERAEDDRARLRAGAPREPHARPVRYHDSCQLGRGLGLYDAPRSVLARALGRAPDEFGARREQAACSGAGGLLPRTMPEVSRGITKARLAEHDRDGGGRIVTGCASSLLAFRRRGAQAEDLTSWIARAVVPWRP
jgi:Fe-S oxidoreductase